MAEIRNSTYISRKVLNNCLSFCHRESETHFSSDTDFEDIEGKNQKQGKGKVCIEYLALFWSLRSFVYVYAYIHIKYIQLF